MKKLIAISVVFALIAGGIFAADVGIDVFGSVSLFGGTTAKGDDDIVGGGTMNRIRLSGSGGNDDGTFGAWYRLDDGAAFNAFVWWKPIDQLKMTIGGNPDNFYGKEGVTGWGFNGMPNDINIVDGGATVWGWNPDYNWSGGLFRNAFFGGYGGRALMFDIYPVDMATITVILPYLDKNGAEVATIFKNVIAQVDVQLDGIGSFALTFENAFAPGAPANPGNPTATPPVPATPAGKDAMNTRIYGYFNLTSIENMSLDLGVSFGFGDGLQLNTNTVGYRNQMWYGAFKEYNPIAVGVGLKYDITDEFGIKFRGMGQIAGADKAPTVIIADIQPYYAISDDMKFSFDAGIQMLMPDSGDTEMGWHVTPYLHIGGEYGPDFCVGFKLYSVPDFGGTDDVIKWSVPIGIQVGF